MTRVLNLVMFNPPIHTNKQIMDKIHIMVMDNLHHMVASLILLGSQLIKLLILVRLHILVSQVSNNSLIQHLSPNIQELSQSILNRIIKLVDCMLNKINMVAIIIIKTRTPLCMKDK